MRPSPRPWIIAHRGASRDCPENTLAAFDEALLQGSDGLELDVQLSRDEVPVVYHDKTLTRAGGGRRRVARLDWNELCRLDPGARFDRRFRGEHIPSLEQVLDRYGRRTRLFVEIKTREGRGGRDRHRLLAARVAELVERMSLVKNVEVLSFDPDVLEASRRQASRVRRVLNLRPPRRISAGLRRRLETLSALSLDVRSITPGFAAAVQELGRPVLAYTCNTRTMLRRALTARVRGVISDRPGWLASELDGRDAA